MLPQLGYIYDVGTSFQIIVAPLVLQKYYRISDTDDGLPVSKKRHVINFSKPKEVLLDVPYQKSMRFFFTFR